MTTYTFKNNIFELEAFDVEVHCNLAEAPRPAKVEVAIPTRAATWIKMMLCRISYVLRTHMQSTSLHTHQSTATRPGRRDTSESFPQVYYLFRGRSNHKSRKTQDVHYLCGFTSKLFQVRTCLWSCGTIQWNGQVFSTEGHGQSAPANQICTVGGAFGHTPTFIRDT